MAHSSCHSQVPSLDSTLSPPLLLLYSSSSFCLPYSPLSVPELSLRLAQRLFIQYGAPLLGRLVMPSHLIGYSPHVQPLSGSLGRISNFCTVHWPGKPGRRLKLTIWLPAQKVAMCLAGIGVCLTSLQANHFKLTLRTCDLSKNIFSDL